MTPRDVVSVSGLTRDFGTLRAVDDLTLGVRSGELFGIVGPDGAGKTTTLRMLAGVMRPTSGDVMVAGASVVQDPEAVKHHIAYMSQRFGLYTDLTVRENIDFYADLFRVPRDERGPRLQRLYEFSGLGPFEHRLAGKLSGGMRQKLGLCCALIHEPEILLLDEPTFGVDPISRRDLWLILHGMVARGTTVIVSTAYLDEAERCDRVALLHRGRLLALEPPTSLQDRLSGRMVMIRADKPRLALRILRQESSVRHAALFGDTIHVVTGDAAHDRASLRQALTSHGIDVTAVEEGVPSLEDVFIQLVTSEAAA
jgi:ABC-type multidrug transport system ATPase subunit